MSNNTEVIILVNTDGGNSQMCYFSDAAGSQSGQAPLYVANVTPPHSGQDIIWEGQVVNGSFQGSSPFQTQIQGNAAAQPFGTQVGLGYQGPNFAPEAYAVFGIYRDNGRVVYVDPSLGNCRALYYCFEVSSEPPCSL